MSRPHCRCPVLVVVVPSSLSCRCRGVLVLSSLWHPRPVIIVASSSCRRCPSRPVVVPSFPLPCRLVLVLFVVTCSTNDPSCEQWLAAMGWVLGCFVVVVVLLFLVFWSSSRCRVPRRRPVVVVLVSWYRLRRRRCGRWPPLFVLEHPRSTLRAAARSGGVGAGWPSSSVVLTIV